MCADGGLGVPLGVNKRYNKLTQFLKRKELVCPSNDSA